MNRPPTIRPGLILPCVALAVLATVDPSVAKQIRPRPTPWSRHIIDDSSKGADGVKLADVNGDGLMDIVTGWEEGGITRIYCHPGHETARRRWPAVTVGKTPNVEDATFVDLDADGRIDVVSCCEGRTRKVFVHWAPKLGQDYMDRQAWKTEAIPASQNRMMWMFSVAWQVDGGQGMDLVAAGKGADCQIGWFQAPDNPRKLADWRWHPISPAGWVMSLRMLDMDGDGDADVFTSDRKGPLRGCRWLENPGPGATQRRPWKNHFIGGQDKEVMFLAAADLDGDGARDVICAARGAGFLFFRGHARNYRSWEPLQIKMPGNTGTGKGVAVADIDADGTADLVFSCESASGEKSGLMWLSFEGFPLGNSYKSHEISGPVGTKFDRLEVLDMDGDGDLDVLTCEESHPVDGKRRGLGVLWYENPLTDKAQ
jgi:VCBS repeat protein